MARYLWDSRSSWTLFPLLCRISWFLPSLVMPEVKQYYSLFNKIQDLFGILHLVFWFNEYLATPTIFPTFKKGFWVLPLGSIGWRACFHHQVMNKIIILPKINKRIPLHKVDLKFSLTFDSLVKGQLDTDKLCAFTHI